MCEEVNPEDVMIRQHVGAETPVGDMMLAIVMNENGAAQAQLRDKDYRVIGVTPTIELSGVTATNGS